VGEELGFVGVAATIGLFMVFAWAGWRIARAALSFDTFGFLLAAGITMWITIQAAVNLAVVSGAAPTKGIALPFISYGGSGLVVTLAATGILVSVAREAHRRRRVELAGGDW
jgi:cell division protein FtsW